jgi:glucose-1-phosphate thymidylyltransferase
LHLRQTDQQLPVVGVIPMAGRATRLAGLPCSKELFPTGLTGSGAARRPQAVCERLLGALQNAGLSNVYLVIRDGKWDIPTYLGDGSRLGLHLAYLLAGRPWGTPYSIDQAYPFVRNHRVALGFPDLHFTDEPVFSRLLAHQSACGADVVLGLFPAARPDKVDMVELGAGNRVKQIVIKPATSRLQHTWGVAVWTPAFSSFMHRFLEMHGHSAADTAELFVGDVFRAGLEAGLDIQGLPVSAQPFVDIGTWDDLLRVLG